MFRSLAIIGCVLVTCLLGTHAGAAATLVKDCEAPKFQKAQGCWRGTQSFTASFELTCHSECVKFLAGLTVTYDCRGGTPRSHELELQDAIADESEGCKAATEREDELISPQLEEEPVAGENDGARALRITGVAAAAVLPIDGLLRSLLKNPLPATPSNEGSSETYCAFHREITRLFLGKPEEGEDCTPLAAATKKELPPPVPGEGTARLEQDAKSLLAAEAATRLLSNDLHVFQLEDSSSGHGRIVRGLELVRRRPGGAPSLDGDESQLVVAWLARQEENEDADLDSSSSEQPCVQNRESKPIRIWLSAPDGESTFELVCPPGLAHPDPLLVKTSRL